MKLEKERGTIYMSNNPKIKNLGELTDILSKLKAKGKKIIHCHGVFDLMHPGHIRHFRAAKSLGDILIVTVTRDEHVNKGPGRPVFSQELRAESIAALECVDYVAVNLWPTAVRTIKMLGPNIYVKGQDYSDVEKDETCGIILEREAVESVGGRIHFTDEITFSSSSLLNEHFGIYPEHVGSFLKNFKQKYPANQVAEQLGGLKDIKALVIGETILDEYHFVAPIGKSPKGTHIAAKLLSEETHAGGILACANNLASLCGHVELITAIGKNDNKEGLIRGKLKPNILPRFFHYEQAPTIVKRRFLEPAYFTKLFEIYICDDNFAIELEDGIGNYIADALSKQNYDLVLILDYGHGLLTPKLINLLCSSKVFLAVNAQTNTANMGFNPITKYPRANYFCLDMPELRMAFADKHSDLEKLIEKLGKRVSPPGAVCVTLGPRGAIMYNPEDKTMFNIPVFSQNIIDTTGAGDALLAITAPCVAKGFPPELVGFIGNAVGALAVTIVGNREPVGAAQLLRFITTLLK